MSTGLTLWTSQVSFHSRIEENDLSCILKELLSRLPVRQEFHVISAGRLSHRTYNWVS